MSIPPINPTSPGSPAPSTPPEKINYLNRCVENISPASIKHHQRAALINKTIAVATSVVYIAAVIASVALTAIFSPASIPITSLSMFFMLDPVHRFVSSRLSVARASLDAAETCKTIAEIASKLPDNKDEIEKLLPDNLQISTEAQVSDLKPVVAHYLYWHDKGVEYDRISQNKRQEQQDHHSKYPTELDEITQIRLEHIAYEEASLVAKTNAAFWLAIIQKPSFSSAQYDIMKYGTTVDASDPTADFVTLGQRSVADLFGDRSQKIMFALKNSTGQVFDYEKQELKNESEANLAARLLS